MLKLFQFLVFGHIHKWKIIKEKPVFEGRINENVIIGYIYHLQCEKCGNLKFKNSRN